MSYLFLKWVHILSSTVLFGTGVGSAFYMFMANRRGDIDGICFAVRHVVIADWLFTATSVVAQPVTGVLLARQLGWSLAEGWIVLSLALYVMVGAFWLPVVAIQIKMRDLARQSADDGAPLPDAYHRLFRIWFACGVPAFAGVLAILWLMSARPEFGV